MTSKDAATRKSRERLAFGLTVPSMVFQIAVAVLTVTVFTGAWWEFVLVIGSAVVALVSILAFWRAYL